MKENLLLLDKISSKISKISKLSELTKFSELSKLGEITKLNKLVEISRISKINQLYNKKLSRHNILLFIYFFITIFALWQGLESYIQSQYITKLSLENSELRDKLTEIGVDIERLSDSHSDIRIFQREIIQAIKEIDDHSAAQFVSLAKELSHGHPESYQVQPEAHLVEHKLSKSELALAKIDFSISETKRESGALLAKTMALKNIMTLVPSLTPTDGYISSNFGTRIDPFKGETKRHEGIDIAGPIGTPVYAPADGVVILATTNKNFGKMIELKHKYGVITRFGHMNEILALEGQKVKRGQQIGSIGNTGDRCQGAHLHYEVRQGNKKFDPSRFMLAKPVHEDSVIF